MESNVFTEVIKPEEVNGDGLVRPSFAIVIVLIVMHTIKRKQVCVKVFIGTNNQVNNVVEVFTGTPELDWGISESLILGVMDFEICLLAECFI